MRAPIKTGIVTLAGAFAIGTLGLGAAVAGTGSDQVGKREEAAGQLVAVDDVDDDDDNDDLTAETNTGTRGTNSRISRDNGTRTGVSRASRDGTNSRTTRVSRDRDRSRGDLTRDLTNDGPGKNNLDDSRNHTNDRSRNDTR